MKVCKKCKKHVANKMKICKYCGADVSKAKIIKTSTKNSAINNSKTKLKTNTNTMNNSKTNPKTNVETNSLKVKNENNNIKKQENVNKSLELKNKENINANKKEKKDSLKGKNKSLKFNKISDNKKTKKKKDVKESKLKNKFIQFKSKVKTLFIRNNKSDKVKVKNNKFSEKISFLKNKIKLFFVKCSKFVTSRKAFNTKLSYKTLLIVAVCLFVLGFSICFGIDIYKDVTNAENTVVAGEKATTEKVFGMGDLITYNGIDYKVLKVETSEGNSYKAPKEGNQFLIVTIYMKNNTGEKVSYSYKNWTMSNSLGEEEKRIFTSVNVDTALYSGNLVIGGIKTGSMVFEQPIKDPKLRMNFYELKKDKNGEEVVDTSNKIFSVSIKVPEEVSPDGENASGTKKQDVSDAKVINTSDKKGNKRT